MLPKHVKISNGNVTCLNGEIDYLLSKVNQLEQENEALKDSNEHLAVLLAEAKSEVAREIFWEIDKLLTMIYTDDEDGSKFIGVDMQKYYALKKKYTEGEK